MQFITFSNFYYNSLNFCGFLTELCVCVWTACGKKIVLMIYGTKFSKLSLTWQTLLEDYKMELILNKMREAAALSLLIYYA